MLRYCAPLLTGLLLLTTSLPARAADPPAGTWRITFPVQTRQGERNLSLLMMFSESDGKWVADYLDADMGLPGEPAVDLTVNKESVKFTFKFGPNNWSFDGKVSGKRIKGSLDLGAELLLVEMVPSSLKSLTKDRFAVAKEVLENSETPADFFNALLPVIAQAGAKKLKPDDVRAYAEKATQLAEQYGSRWQRTMAFRIADLLADQEPYVAIAV